MSFDVAIDRALRNISKFGDTDVFPIPFERNVFFHKHAESKAIIQSIHGDLDTWLATQSTTSHECLAQVGYTGFRWAAHIEPFWNAYYLSLVLGIAEKIEHARLPEDKVFSYRFDWSDEESKIFKDSTWMDYRRKSIEHAKNSQFVVIADIADFYPRIYHHRVENALLRITDCDTPSRIMKLLTAFSKNVSYGLPVGGPASRILAELALCGTDRLLVGAGMNFCRYADDYTIFCESEQEAYSHLVTLSQKLFIEGLVLQKKKTRILSAGEYLDINKQLDPAREEDNDEASDESKLLSISVRYDPYSPTAEEDYEALAAAVREVDVVGILSREIAKTAIDTTVAKQAVRAIKAMDNEFYDGAVRTMLDKENLATLAPVFVSVMRTIRSVYEDLEGETKDFVDGTLVELFNQEFYVLKIDVNLCYYIQVLGKRHSVEKEEILTKIFLTTTVPLIKRLVFVAMTNWSCHHWLSEKKNNYSIMGVWERRAMIASSYVLREEGKHWRDKAKKGWNEIEKLIHEWAADKSQKGEALPL